jgi:hypothetical protein
MDGGTSSIWGPNFQIFFMSLLRVLEETKKERWPPSLFFSFGGYCAFYLFFFSYGLPTQAARVWPGPPPQR